MANDALGTKMSLTVLNKNSEHQTFALYQTLPDLDKADVDFQTLAWMVGVAAPGSDSNPSKAQFHWTIDYSVSAGYIQDEGDALSPRSFNETSTLGVRTDMKNEVTLTYLGTFPDGVPAFTKDSPRDGKTVGLVRVKSDGLMPTDDDQASKRMKLNLGFAMDKRPVIALSLNPNKRFDLTPKPSYYILSGTYIAGQVVDADITTDDYRVDFNGETSVTITFNEDNSFSKA